MLVTGFRHLAQLAQAGVPSRSGGGDGGLLRWLLGLERVDPTDPSAVLSWGVDLPAWAWLLIVVAILGVAGESYRRLLGRKSGRVALAAVRGGVLLAIAMLLARPMLVLPRENVEEDHVLLLVDRSASMSVRDVTDADRGGDPPIGVGGERRSRHEQLVEALESNEAAWRALAREHRLQWIGFSDRTMPVSSAAGYPRGLEPPEGRATVLRTAIQEALLRAAGKPIGAMVVLSDGRSTEPLDPELWRQLQQLGVQVWTVPLGSAVPPPDLAIERVEAPDRAFVDDTVPVTVTVSRRGEGASGADTAAGGTVVRLVDETTGRTLDERPVGRFGEPVRLMHTPRAAGMVTWRAELIGPEPELIEQNNRQTLEMELVDRPIRLLLVEGYPRWEYRYLKNLAVRERSIESSIMLISADRTFAQEGDVPLQRLPRTERELEPYDVIVIGDVPANFFSAEQQRLIERQVSVNGAGLMWIGGVYDTPVSYAASPLASLLPIGNAASVSLLSPPIELVPTPAAEGLGVLRLRPVSGEDAEELWPRQLPPLRWAQAVRSPKSATEALAVDANSGQPLVMRMRYGAGQSLYVATDETWRWRYGRGELYTEQFWMQLIRLLARSRLQAGTGGEGRAMLTISHRRATMDQTLVVELVIRDQTLLEQPPPWVEVEVGPADAADGAGAAHRLIVLGATDRAGRYQGRWSPQTPGRRKLRVVTAPLSELGLELNVTVEDTDAELRYPATNHELLAELAERTGGEVLPPERVSELSRLIPNRARHTAADVAEPLWHSPLALAVLVLLLSGEWIGRRLLGLA